MIFNSKTIDDHTYKFSRTYNNVGSQLSITYPDGRTINRTRDAAQRLTSISNFVSAFQWSPQGKLAGFDYTNGVKLRKTFGILGQMTQEQSLNSQNEVLHGYQYTYDQNGNILSVNSTAADSMNRLTPDITYQYDTRFRVVRAELNSGQSSEEVVNFNYGANNNILSRTSSLGNASPAHLGNYTYGSSHPNAVTQAGNKNFSYNASGFVTQRGDHHLTFDFLGRLTNVKQNNATVAEISYGAGAKRTKRVENHETTTMSVLESEKVFF